jgi:hypothetical protein
MSAASDTATPSRDQLLQSPGGVLYLKSWLLNRLVIGILGVLMPIVLIGGEAWIFNAERFPRGSLSAYYFSPLSGVFVGTLCATGVFLVTYMCFHRNIDNLASTVAGIAAILVALVPTWPDAGDTPTALQNKLGQGFDQNIHTWSAVVFIAMLAWISWRFGEREGERGNTKLSWTHRALSVVMGGTAALALVLNYGFGVKHLGNWSGLLIVELVCSWAFGLSWLLKGAELSDTLVARRWFGAEATERLAVEPESPAHDVSAPVGKLPGQPAAAPTTPSRPQG